MRGKLPPFRDGDERDEWRWKVSQLTSTARLLPLLGRDPELVRYRLTGMGDDRPRLPSHAEMARAEHVLQQAAEALAHYYGQRARPDDPPPLPQETVDLDDEEPL